jgi:Fe-S cluster assembly ATP-binding protein
LRALSTGVERSWGWGDRVSYEEYNVTSLLEVIDLCIEVEGQEILHDVNLTIPEGEVHALLGPNGSGKTSLMMAIMGFPDYEVYRGQILFDGEDITELGLTERARLGLGVAQQRPPTITGVKLGQILNYVATDVPQWDAEVKALVKAAQMEQFLDRDVNAGLSGGEIKRSELLQLLATRPRFAMMDEPGSGVDLEALELVGDLINTLFSRDAVHPAKRRAGLVITHTGHILNYVHADKAHVMLGGRIGCLGNPRIIFDHIRESGYEECVRCMNEKGV